MMLTLFGQLLHNGISGFHVKAAHKISRHQNLHALFKYLLVIHGQDKFKKL